MEESASTDVRSNIPRYFQAPLPVYLGRTEFRMNALEADVGSFSVCLVELNGWGHNLNTFLAPSFVADLFHQLVRR
jgi:hypothetical protein